ncbi:PAX3- and PAX7-binding protein 1-like isoform X2 [Ostrea edulis]|uniref:PAX3- and PAX7-binding protein 1-like isoform X2 n=1 Tax=Ostrea edulis TaxID=37623 RepID=UPI0020944110|nr:PAX3- and PAX7-binding protein 1-like isoform X2 [Ostrea edulis]
MSTSFRKPRRNFRKKITVDSESEDEKQEVIDVDNDQNDNKPQIFSDEKKQKKKKKDKESQEMGMHRTSSVLSFNEDQEEGEVFKVKKSSHSKRIARQLKMQSKLAREEEEKHQKKEETPPRKASPVRREEPREERDEEIRRLRAEFQSLNGEDAEENESEEETEGGIPLKKMMKKGEIPDATMIHMIRKKRQQARDIGDFIPLDDTDRVENSKSRLVRDDDNDKSDDEDDERIDFSVNTQARERIKIQNDFLAAEHGSDNEDSDQEREWEEQQIKKGVSLGSEQTDGVASTGPSHNDHYNDHYNGYQEVVMEKKTFTPFQSLTQSGDCKVISMEIIRRRLQDRLNSMDEVHRSHTQERDSLVSDISDTEKSIETCQEKVAGLEGRYRFFQEMRGYVRDLVDCLSEKVPEINNLEQRMLNLWKNQARKFLSRRQQDVRDQCQEYMTSNVSVNRESPEFQERQRRAAEREARRSRRRRAREMKDIVGHHDGLSSDDEENHSEIAKYNLEKESVLGAQEQVFEDVVEDFSEVESVREKFEDWKQTYRETYQDAYIGLCLPKLLNPYIRLSLINWNPLEANCADFEDMKWFDTLVFYGFRLQDTVFKGDDDIGLLPSIVEKVLLPKLTVTAESIWDPLSTTQTSRLVNVISKLSRDYPCIQANNKATQYLLNAIVKRIRTTLEDDVFMPLYPKAVIDNRSTNASVFFHRQLWVCIKLLGNILSWHGILSNQMLRSLSLDGLLNRYIILGLCNSGVNKETIQKCQSIISTFPKEWFTDLDEDKTMPQLENVSRFLVSAAKTVYQEGQSKNDYDKRDSREFIKQISKMLVNIHAMEYAVNLPM